MTGQADKVSHASLNGIYVKAQEMDRGHNEAPAPAFAPPGAFADAASHASDASTHASDGLRGEERAAAAPADAQAHATSHASERADASTHASDGDASTHATG